MNKTILIVDGHNLLFQMFYGMPNKIYNQEGFPIHGVIGFIGALLKIIKINNPDYVIVLFDKEQEILRQDINENYKKNRINYNNVPLDENPFSQLENIYKVLDIMNIKYTEVDLVETDDMIASYCFEYMNDYNIIISSFDTDFYSLINDNVKVFRYRGKKSQIIDRQYIKEKFDIEANLFADYKSLIGDTADNIKGISGIGPKTASKLINTYGTISNIIKNVNKIENQKLREKIINNNSILEENIRLIKYTQKYDLPYELSELKINISDDIKTMNLLKKANIVKT